MRAEPVVRFVDVDGLALAAHDWSDDASAQRDPIVLVHATGLCARVWDPVVALLPAHARVIAVDLRGHGRSDCPEPIEERFRWRRFGEDIAVMLAALDLHRVTLVGHSMGGHSATVAALEAPDRVARLVLLDPTFTPPRNPEEPLRPPASEQPSRRRRNEWPSPDACYDNLRDKPNFATWQEAALRAYTTHGLRPASSAHNATTTTTAAAPAPSPWTGEGAGEGSPLPPSTPPAYVLACPPLFEASIYAGNQAASLDDDLPKLDIPVHVLRARPRTPDDPPGLGPSATRLEALARLRHLVDRQHPSAGHFFPQEDPALAAAFIREAIGQTSDA